MSRSNRLVSGCFWLILSLAGNSHAVEILHWQRLPLTVPLHVDEERVIFVNRDVRVGVPALLASRLRVQSAGGAIYLRANETLEATRLQLQDTNTGDLILLDVAATPADDNEAPLEPVRIVTDSAEGSDSASPADAGDIQNKRRNTPIPVALTRYAAQSLYAPLRTVEPVPGLSRVTLSSSLKLDNLAPVLPLRARALAAWRLDDYWLTTVLLTNTTDHWLALDPRILQGDFVAATFQHTTLGPRGEPTDTTVLYLVTRGHGLADALLPMISPVDAATNLPGGQGADNAE